MIILSVNAGSSSLKFTCFEMPSEKVLVNGLFERIGIDGSSYTIKINGEKIKKEVPIKEHSEAVKILVEELINHGVVKTLDEIKAVGHRVVHGGDKYRDSVIINNDVLNTIEELIPLAPLHNPANLMGIKAFMEYIPDAIQIAVFDTSFSQTMEKEKFLYAVPYEWYTDYGVRKYAFHGISHEYITECMRKYLNKDKVNIITCHLGNGSSIFAIKDSKCYDSSLSFSTNSGLIMGTRCGDIDPFIIPYMMREANLSFEEVENILNKKSGLLGISGVSSDSRDIEDGIKSGNERCILAQKLFVNRASEYIAKFWFNLKNVDAICFAGGIGENSILTRKQIIENLSPLGIVLDEEANNTRGEFKLITKEESSIPCYIVPTDEEVMIARDSYKLINKD